MKLATEEVSLSTPFLLLAENSPSFFLVANPAPQNQPRGYIMRNISDDNELVSLKIR